MTELLITRLNEWQEELTAKACTLEFETTSHSIDEDYEKALSTSIEATTIRGLLSRLRTEISDFESGKTV